MSSLDVTFNILPVTSHGTADYIRFRMMSLFCKIFFFSGLVLLFWGAYFILCGLLYFVKIIFISLLSRSLGRALPSLLVRRVCTIAKSDC
jgi:hypothetical protein